jgi:transcription elongation factor Elf1
MMVNDRGEETAIRFQCPRCGHELEQTLENLRSSKFMRCPGCEIGINIDTDRLANAAEEIRRALAKVPSEITIKFFDSRHGNDRDGLAK